MTPAEADKGFLHIPGTRVFVTGTKHHGCKGTVVETPRGWSRRAQAVRLDEWPDEVFKFYLHNLIRLPEA